MAYTLEDFESGSFSSGWTDTSNTSIHSSPSRGSYSGGKDGGSWTNPLGVYSLDSPDTFDTFECYYYETSNSTGSGIYLKDSSGNIICKFGTDNPEWTYTNGQSTYQLSGGSYDTWTYVKVTFDWANDQYDIYFSDGTSDSTNTNKSFWHTAASDLAEFEIHSYSSAHGGWDGGNYVYHWWDDFVVTGETAPSAPSSLSASTYNNDRIDLSWTDNSDNEDGFYIYRSTSSGTSTADYTQVDSVGSNTTSYSDTGLLDGEAYYYRVSAYNMFGESSLSNEASSVTDLPAPSGVSQTVNANDSIDVSWNDNSDNENRFHVQMSRDGSNYQNPSGGTIEPGSNAIGVNYNPNSDQAYQSQVGIDSSFKWRVRAETEHANSSWATSGTAYTDPIPPHNPSVNRPNGDTVEISATVQTDIPNSVEVQYREDIGDGTGYGAWTKLDEFTGNEAHVSGTGADNALSTGETWTASYSVDATYSTTNSFTTDSRVQFRVRSVAPDGGTSDWAYTDYGNNGNVYFQDGFESVDLSGYAGETNNFAASTENPHSGLYAVAKTLDTDHGGIYYNTGQVTTGSALTAEVWIHHDGNNERGGAYLCDTTGAGYVAYFDPGNQLNLGKVSGPGTWSSTLTSTAVSGTASGFYRIQMSTDGAGNLTAEMFDSGGASVVSTTATDSTYDPTTVGIWSYDTGRDFDDLKAIDGSGATVFSDSFDKWDTFSDGDSEEDVMESGDINDEDDLGITGPDTGSHFLVLQSNGHVVKNLGDLSGESDVLVKCVMAAGSMDNSSEVVGIDWYDGTAWHTLKNFGWSYNEQGWVEVTALVPSSYLSTDNRVRFDGYGGGGDYLAVDRVVVSDVLHEHTSPTPPASLSLDTSIEDEITASWTNNATFMENNDVYIKPSGANNWTESQRVSPTTSYTFTGLKDGEEYLVRIETVILQDRHGAANQTQLFSKSTVTGVTVLPAPTGLTVDAVNGDQADVSWTPNHDYGDQRVEVRHDGGAWTIDGDNLGLAATTYTTTALLDGEQYDLSIVAYTEHTETRDQ